MKRTLAWLHPRWGQMLCFTVGGLLLGASFSHRLDMALSIISNFDLMVDRDRALTVGCVLIATGLALKALSIWQNR